MRRASDIIAKVTADNRALLYRCRWCRDDASRVVPELIQVLSDEDQRLVDEALRSLFTIGTPAVAAAPHVAPLIGSDHSITRHLATLALGQIAHKDPSLCIGPVTSALAHEECRHDALRILKFLGSPAKSALADVAPFCESPDARTRKLAILTVISIDGESKVSQQITARARADRSRVVRLAVEKATQNAQPADAPNERPTLPVKA